MLKIYLFRLPGIFTVNLVAPDNGLSSCRCAGTVGAIVTCPLEVIKTRLQSSGLALQQVYYSQVQLGTLSGGGVVRPATSVSPSVLQVLK